MLCEDGFVLSILLAIALAFVFDKVFFARLGIIPRDGPLAQTMLLVAFVIILTPMVGLYVSVCSDTLNTTTWCEYRLFISLLISYPLLMLYQWVILPKIGIDPYSCLKTRIRITFDFPIIAIIVLSIFWLIGNLTDPICMEITSGNHK